jgi:sigma-B regulation protein RsbU (phosphoserine phosphatase)
VTLTVAVYEPRTHRLSLANGGQTRPLLLRPETPPRWMVDRLGTALGLEPDLEFERVDYQLQPGDSVLFYTDGINEAFNPANECYGNERLIQGLTEVTNLAAPCLIDHLLKQVATFTAGAPQSDDITVLALHLPG